MGIGGTFDAIENLIVLPLPQRIPGADNLSVAGCRLEINYLWLQLWQFLKLGRECHVASRHQEFPVNRIVGNSYPVRVDNQKRVRNLFVAGIGNAPGRNTLALPSYRDVIGVDAAVLYRFGHLDLILQSKLRSNCDVAIRHGEVILGCFKVQLGVDTSLRIIECVRYVHVGIILTIGSFQRLIRVVQAGIELEAIARVGLESNGHPFAYHTGLNVCLYTAMLDSLSNSYRADKGELRCNRDRIRRHLKGKGGGICAVTANHSGRLLAVRKDCYRTWLELVARCSRDR